MPSSPEQSRVAMRHKLYNEHCEIQEEAMRAGLEFIPDFPDSRSLTVVDYGCSQGANSIEPLQRVLSTLPDDAVVRVFFEDTPFNDFSSLAGAINSNLPHLTANDKKISVFPTMIPVGFFKQVVPDASADLGFSWSSLNYLETTPAVTLDASAPPAEFAVARHKAFSAAGAKDFVKLLRLRATEIREGGYLVAAIGGQKPANDERPSNPGSAPVQAAMLKMVATGRLEMGELAQMAMFPSHERTPEELRAGLENEEVAGLWDVQALEPKLVEHPAWKTYQRALQVAGHDPEMKEEALKTYAYAVIVNLISASGWFWADVLKKSRGDGWDGAEAFLDELTDLAVAQCVEKFGDMRVEIWYHYVKLKRTSKI